MALPSSAALLLFLLASAQAQTPISLPPASAPTSSNHDTTADGKDSVIAPSADDDTVMSPPGPPESSPSESPAPAYQLPAAPAPAPASADDEDYKKEEEEKKKHRSPAPAPAATMEVKADTGGEQVVVEKRHVDGGKKAGVVVGAFSAAAVVGLAAVVWRKRQANIRRSRYADYSARLELV